MAIKKNLVGVAYNGGKSELNSNGSGESGFNVKALVFWWSVS